MSDLKKIRDEFISKLKGKLDLAELNQIKSDLFGKNGLVSSQFINWDETSPFLPNRSDLIWLSSARSNLPFNFDINSSLIFFRSDIFTDYFFSEIKQ